MIYTRSVILTQVTFCRINHNLAVNQKYKREVVIQKRFLHTCYEKYAAQSNHLQIVQLDELLIDNRSKLKWYHYNT